jgi:hypothetical protein
MLLELELRDPLDPLDEVEPLDLVLVGTDALLKLKAISADFPSCPLAWTDPR